MVFMLASCPLCSADYAIVQDPNSQTQWWYFNQLNPDLDHPTHASSGGLLCALGHDLSVRLPAAVQISDGRWLPVPEGSLLAQMS